MALFKILKGNKDNLGKSTNSTKTTNEGWAYFTPDDGKFYIDTTTGETPTIGYKEESGVNRVCINEWQGVTILNCGDASTT